MKKIAFTTGRYMTFHNGQRAYIENLISKFSKTIIGIGSCYTYSERNCVYAHEREKMIRMTLEADGIDTTLYDIVHIQDYDTFEMWISDIKDICNMYGVTDFVTGNNEDILDVIESGKYEFTPNIINPEIESKFSVHSTSIRNAFRNGDIEFVQNNVPFPVLQYIFSHNTTLEEIVEATTNPPIAFNQGRQTVDLVFIVRDIETKEDYVLLGKRNLEMEDFPGYWGVIGGEIKKYESPVDSVIRNFYENTGLKIDIVKRAFEPTIVKFDSQISDKLETLHFIDVYKSNDEKNAGSRGGSSQCFADRKSVV